METADRPDAGAPSKLGVREWLSFIIPKGCRVKGLHERSRMCTGGHDASVSFGLFSRFHGNNASLVYTLDDRNSENHDGPEIIATFGLPDQQSMKGRDVHFHVQDGKPSVAAAKSAESFLVPKSEGSKEDNPSGRVAGGKLL